MSTQSKVSPPRTSLADFNALVDPYSRSIADLARAARWLLLSVLPEAYEVVWQRQKTVGYGTGPKKQSEHFCWIAPASKHVTLGFNYGAELPDPAGLLEGTGKLFRHALHAKKRKLYEDVIGDADGAGALDLDALGALLDEDFATPPPSRPEGAPSMH